MPLRYVPRSISSAECVGNTLSTINISFSALDTATHLLSTHVDFLSSTMISVSSTLQSRIMFLSTKMIEVSSVLQTEINFLSATMQTVSGNLQSEINFLSATMQTVSGNLQSEINFVSGNLQTEINFLSSNILTPRISHISNDHVLTTTNLVAVSNLYFNVDANKHYHYDFTIDYVNSINSEGLTISLSGTAAYSSLRFYGIIYHANDGTVAAQGVKSAYGNPIIGTTGHTSVSGTAYLRGSIQTTGAGQVMLMAATETGGGNNSTINAGGYGSIVAVQESH